MASFNPVVYWVVPEHQNQFPSILGDGWVLVSPTSAVKQMYFMLAKRKCELLSVMTTNRKEIGLTIKYLLKSSASLVNQFS